jgi:hypothetical protein
VVPTVDRADMLALKRRESLFCWANEERESRRERVIIVMNFMWGIELLFISEE